MPFLDPLNFGKLSRQSRERSLKKDGGKGGSFFGKDPFLSRSVFSKRIRQDPGSKIFSETKFARSKREDLAKKSLLKTMGPNIDQKDIQEGKKQIALGGSGKYKDLPEKERKDLKKFFDAVSENP